MGLKVIDDEGLMVVMNAYGGVFGRIMVKMVMVAVWGLIVAGSWCQWSGLVWLMVAGILSFSFKFLIS